MWCALFPVYGVFVRIIFCQVAFDQRGYVEEELMQHDLKCWPKKEIRNTM